MRVQNSEAENPNQYPQEYKGVQRKKKSANPRTLIQKLHIVSRRKRRASQTS